MRQKVEEPPSIGRSRQTWSIHIAHVAAGSDGPLPSGLIDIIVSAFRRSSGHGTRERVFSASIFMSVLPPKTKLRGLPSMTSALGRGRGPGP